MRLVELGVPLYLFDLAAFVRRQVIPLGCKMLKRPLYWKAGDTGISLPI
jgi:hypothetical protein